MPKIANTCEYLAGYISAKVGELQGMLDVLASQAEFSETEMQNMRERINLNDASVRQQHREIENPRLRPKLNMYEQILELSIAELKRREQHRGQRPPESEAMRARRLRSDADYEPYASDGRGPVPLEYWTVVNPAPRRVPITAEDLRHALHERRTGQDYRTWTPVADQPMQNNEEVIPREIQAPARRVSDVDNDDEAGPSGIQNIRPSSRTTAQSRMDEGNDNASTRSYRSRDDSPGSARSRSSVSSYVSSRQSVFSHA